MRPPPRPPVPRRTAGRLRRWSALAATAGLSLCAACGAGVPSPPAVGPLQDVSNPTTFCLSSPVGRAVAVGWDILELSSGAPAVVQDVALDPASGVRLVGAVLVPVGAEEQVGNGWTWPLTAREVSELPPGIPWPKARNAAGATIPAVASTQQNLVVGLAPTGPGGGTARIVVDYTVGSARYRMTTAAGVTVKVPPQGC